MRKKFSGGANRNFGGAGVGGPATLGLFLDLDHVTSANPCLVGSGA